MKCRYVTIMLLLLVAVHGYESLPFGYPSSEDFPLSEPDFSQDFPDKTFLSFESGDFLDSENTFLPPQEILSDSDKTSQSVEPDDTNMPLEISQIHETDLHSDILRIPKSPAPSPVPAKAPVPAEAPAPAKAPVPAEAPSSPKPPLIIQTTCKKNCSAKCSSKKIPILHNLCNKVCTGRCVDFYWQAIYNCTNRCAESMPEVFKSDRKKETAYVRHCLGSCTKKYID